MLKVMKNLFTIMFLCIVCLFSDKSNCAQGNQHISGYSKMFCTACNGIDDYCSEKEVFVPQTLNEALCIKELHLDFEHPLHIAYLLTKWMTCVIWHQCYLETADPKFDGSSFYIPVYKPMMYYLLSLHARLSQQGNHNEQYEQASASLRCATKCVEEKLAEANAQNEDDERILEKLRTLFQDNNSRTQTNDIINGNIIDTLNKMLTNENSAEDFSFVFVDYIKYLCPQL